MFRNPSRVRRALRTLGVAVLALGLGGCPWSTVEVTVQGLASGSLLKLKDHVTGEELEITESGVHPFEHQTFAHDVRIESAPAGHRCEVTKATYEWFGAGIFPEVQDVRVTCISAADCAGDSDADGLSDCRELDLGTHPWRDDTDGDGFTDGEEVDQLSSPANRFRFNPRIADLPLLDIELVEAPRVDMLYTTQSAQTEVVGSDHSQTSSRSQSSHWGGGTSRMVALGHSVNVSRTDTVAVGFEVGPTDAKVTGEYSVSLQQGMERSVTNTTGSTWDWSREQTASNSETYAQHEEMRDTQGVTVEGAVLTAAVVARNRSGIAYDLSNLTLTASFYDPEFPASTETIATLRYADGAFPTTSVTTDSESIRWPFSAEIPISVAERILRDSRQMVVEPATFLLADGVGGSIVLADQTIAARTAEIVVDFGPEANRQDVYRVAVDNGDGSQWISAREALADVLGLTVEQGRGRWRFGSEAAARDAKAGLTRLAIPELLGLDFAMSAEANRYWMVAHNHAIAQGAARETDLHHILMQDYDLSSTRLYAGDTITLVLVSDGDRDGLEDRQERELGTDPASADTDGDGLLDSEEVYGFALQGCSTTPAPEASSNPLKVDTDGDGEEDGVERARCSDPGLFFWASAGDDQEKDLREFAIFEASIEERVANAASCRWTLREPGVATPLHEHDGCLFVYTTDRVGSFDVRLEVTVDDPEAGAVVREDTARLQVWKERNDAAFVVPFALADPSVGTRDGSRERPYTSLVEGLADPFGRDLYVMGGAPFELVDSVVVPAGVSLFGGYDRDWVRRPSTAKSQIAVEVNGAGPAIHFASIDDEAWFAGFHLTSRLGAVANGADMVALAAGTRDDEAEASGRFHLEDNRIEAGAARDGGAGQAGGSSYGVYAANLSKLEMARNFVAAGAAGRGSNGVDGVRGTNGEAGSDGAEDDRVGGAGADGARSGGDAAQPNGGNGGWGAQYGGDSYDGGAGAKGSDPLDGAGGAKGDTNGKNTGPAGGSGAAGRSGPEGSADLDAPGLSAQDGYVPGGGGSGGRGGYGGGGGGGAGGGDKNFCFCEGDGGGGGGSGGSPGTGGTGAQGGGASIAVFVHEVVSVKSQDDELRGGNGGLGGRGGRGGNGGTGGAGGDDSTGNGGHNGGDGGRGGNGGRGGHGASGPGGPSYGMLLGSNVAVAQLRDAQISAGAGGASGTNGDDVVCEVVRIVIPPRSPWESPRIEKRTVCSGSGLYGEASRGGDSVAIQAWAPVSIQGCGEITPGPAGAGGDAAVAGSAGRSESVLYQSVAGVLPTCDVFDF
ncbi:MAG: hypothetical protein QNK03_06150 [Myxococcota bacterium]|nr:hypothetical protein [Myxococcota bacterium]